MYINAFSLDLSIEEWKHLHSLLASYSKDGKKPISQFKDLLIPGSVDQQIQMKELLDSMEWRMDIEVVPLIELPMEAKLEAIFTDYGFMAAGRSYLYADMAMLYTLSHSNGSHAEPGQALAQWKSIGSLRSKSRENSIMPLIKNGRN